MDSQSDHQIDLLPLIGHFLKIIFKRKRLVLAIWILTLLGALGTSFLIPPRYRTAATVQVGRNVWDAWLYLRPDKIGTDYSLIYPGPFMDEVRYRFPSRDDPAAKRPYVYGFTQSGNADPDYSMKVEVEGNTPQEAYDFIGKILDYVFNDHAARVKDARIRMETLQKELNEHHQEVKDRMAELLKMHTKVAQKDPALAALSVTERVRLLEYIPQLLQEKTKISNLVSKLDWYPSRLVIKPFVPKNPVFPNKRFIVLMGFLLGFPLGVSIAVLLELLCLAWKRV